MAPETRAGDRIRGGLGGRPALWGRRSSAFRSRREEVGGGAGRWPLRLSARAAVLDHLCCTPLIL